MTIKANILKCALCAAAAIIASQQVHAQIFDYFGFPFGDFSEVIPQQEIKTSSAPTLFYNTTFEYNFDNREYDAGDELFSKSQTLNAARLTPTIGVEVNQNERISHRLTLGIDIMKEMGNSPTSSSEQNLQNWKLFHEMTLYYQIQARAGKSLIEGYAGVYPRRMASGEYSRAFISDSLKFYDNNLEGLLIKISRPKFYFETGLDWNGKYSYNRRESFVIFGEALGKFTDWLEVGIDGSYHHLATSGQIPGVIDNCLFEPFVKFDLTEYLPLDKFVIKAGYYQGFQNDRVRYHYFIHPSGGEITLDLSKWNFGIEKTVYYGCNLMPYYNDTDILGNRLGSQLYYGSPLYQNRMDKRWKENEFSDRVEVYYRPHICSFMDLSISGVFYFGEKYTGCKQMLSVFFDLERINSRGNSSRGAATRTSSRRQKAERPVPKGLQSL